MTPLEYLSMAEEALMGPEQTSATWAAVMFIRKAREQWVRELVGVVQKGESCPA